MISAGASGDADSASSFLLDGSTVLAPLHSTFAALRTHRAPRVGRIRRSAAKHVQINESLIVLNNEYACRNQRTSPNDQIFQINEVLLYWDLADSHTQTLLANR